MFITSIPTFILSPRTSEVILVPDSSGDGIVHLISTECYMEEDPLTGKTRQKTVYTNHGLAYRYDVEGQKLLDLTEASKHLPGSELIRVPTVQWESPTPIEKVIDLEERK